jgi:ABC-2 type transport system ATP-binding protein
MCSCSTNPRTPSGSRHILAEVAQTVDRVVILDRGRLVAQSSLEELTSGARSIVRVRSPRADELRVALSGDGVVATLAGSDWLEVAGASPEEIGTLAAGLGIPIFESRTEEANLEDVFLRLTANEPEGAKR